ncbi:hypothetical protein Dsin_031410 [Dipteronia sinensis]|uniref:Uncharacterized protein n=1 Tax=Dipteronia sinensis TaxID=43782 RepID=A0AAD9ZMT5_9ROSI|nr:hypothetical protein Dsin_031410 [Dipteronia sinensis]
METKCAQGSSIPEIGEDNNYSRNNAIEKLNQGPDREPVNVDKCVNKKIRHGPNNLATEKKLLREINERQQKGAVDHPCSSVENFSQLFINKKLLEEFRKEQLEVRSKISCVEKDLEVSRKDIESQRIQLVDLQQKRKEVELDIQNMRKQQNETKARYDRCVSTLSNARDLARKKDVKSLEELSLREGFSICEDKNDTADTSYWHANAAKELNQGLELGESVKIDEQCSFKACVSTLEHLSNRESGIRMALDWKIRKMDDLQEALDKLSFAKNSNRIAANKILWFYGTIECQNAKILEDKIFKKIKRLKKVGRGDTADTEKGKIGNPLNTRKTIQDLVRKARYDKYVSVLSNARELARKKDVEALQELSPREVDIFMCRWNRSKDFRCKYVRIKRKAS